MMLSGHQPVYLPNIQLFSKILLSDVFMFVGHCQFVNKSWHSRNRIRMGDEAQILSIPIKKSGHFGQTITEAMIDGDHWKRKHLGSIKNSYMRTPYFNQYYPELEGMILRPWKRLGALNMALIVMFNEWLDIETPIIMSQNYDIVGQKNDMLISMSKALDADHYLSNLGSISYVDEKYLYEFGVKHCWMDINQIPYEQKTNPKQVSNGAFIENLSIIDAFFNIGPKTKKLVRHSGKIRFGEFAR